MFIKDLITQLQKLIEEHEPLKEQMGEAEIMIDVFSKADNQNKRNCTIYEYGGFSPRIEIERSADGVYPILSAFKG